MIINHSNKTKWFYVFNSSNISSIQHFNLTEITVSYSDNVFFTLRLRDFFCHDHGFFFMCKHHLVAGVCFISDQTDLNTRKKRPPSIGFLVSELFPTVGYFQIGIRPLSRFLYFFLTTVHLACKGVCDSYVSLPGFFAWL